MNQEIPNEARYDRIGSHGANLVRRLSKDGHQCIVYDVNPAISEAFAVDIIAGVSVAPSLEEMLAQLNEPRIVWIMIPASVVGQTIDKLATYLTPDDIIIDGGNSYYRDDILRASMLSSLGIHYIDCGTSGGVFGLDFGYCLMLGGVEKIVSYSDFLLVTG
ncbi:hypothetical protein Undi14_11985 [Undibacterium sp. 14-3-2]|uniref:NAD(P)-binding domain-containing protein n=1 Tax=Undibacterium sp. 14-3-2 TaxID=2800129 RepID=UPI00190811E5|nr:NAD(P)-binding domain-containing protein [Undibacterium sp. 14-3-2]MBK1890753.1 hypothetical protein [Undibacterium sp. 14-3-2]